jgi:hypothetical protein
MKHVGERLQKLEESQKKTNEERGNENEEWEDADRGKQGKEYEKFTKEIKGNVELLRQTLRENQGFEGYLFFMGGITTEPSIQLPPKFVIPKNEKFNGSGDPK